MPPDRTHDVTISDAEVTKRYVEWERGEPDREWACLTLLAEHAPGLAPEPLRRETDPGGRPSVVMSRLPGRSLGTTPLVDEQNRALGSALHRTFDVPLDLVVAGLPAGSTERIHGPTTLPSTVSSWLSEPGDLAHCHDPALVRRAVTTALEWLAAPGALPEPSLTVLGVTDRKPDNLLWDGVTCRFVDLEDSGLSDPSYEVADTVEHLANRGVVDLAALVDAVGLAEGESDRVAAYRPLWAAFWLALLLTRGGVGNPPGTTELQARRALDLIGA